jgi:hypothetical protein
MTLSLQRQCVLVLIRYIYEKKIDFSALHDVVLPDELLVMICQTIFETKRNAFKRLRTEWSSGANGMCDT